jgi:acyl carrier protein
MDTNQLLELFVNLAKKRGKAQQQVSRASCVTELGLDSLQLMETIADLETELHIMIPDEDLIRLQTLGDFVDRVAQLAGTRRRAETS